MNPTKNQEKPSPEREAVRWNWLLVLATGLAVFMVTGVLAHKHTLTGVQLHAFRFINDWPQSLYLFFRAVTIVPQSLWIGVAAVAATFVLKLYRVTWQLALAVIGGYGVGQIAKKLIDLPRPANLVQNVHVRLSDSGASFPSGHTMIVTIILLTLWPYLPKGWRWLTLLFIPLMGLSRIYLGAHQPVDIAGGIALGMMVVGVMRVMPTLMRNFFRLD